MSEKNIVIWHCAKKWMGYPEIKPSKPNRYEHGPGIYGSTNLTNILQYASGGGQIVRLSLTSKTQWLENAKIDFDTTLKFIETSKNLRNKKALINEIDHCFDQKSKDHFKNQIPLIYLLNLAIDQKSVSGKGGIEMAQFLSQNGAQASLCKRQDNENWVVIFDPKIIRKHEVFLKKNIDRTTSTLPTISEQLKIQINHHLSFKE